MEVLFLQGITDFFNSPIVAWIVSMVIFIVVGGGLALIKKVVSSGKRTWKEGKEAFEARKKAAADGQITRDELLAIKKEDDEFFNELQVFFEDSTSLWAAIVNRKKKKK
jgi:uncharacterized membrane protein